MADPEGVGFAQTPFETKLFHFDEEFQDKSGKTNK